MKSLLIALSLAVATMTLAPVDVEAKRLGGGRPAGLQRQMPAKPAEATPHTPAPAGAQPGQQAAAPAAAPSPAVAPGATPGKRSWMGPLAGLAAGIGLAALFSHMGWGEGLSNVVMLALLALVAVVAVRFLLSRLGGGAARRDTLAPAGAAAGGAGGFGMPLRSEPPAPTGLARSADALAPAATAAPGGGLAGAAPLAAGAGPSGAAPLAGALEPAAAAGPAVQAAAPSGAGRAAARLPDGVSHEDFIRLAKMVFIRLQAANDAGDVDDLRRFTTPELFASLRLDLQERAGARQSTDVVRLEAEVADVGQHEGQDVVSVRYWGLIRETAESAAEPFNELWHLVRRIDGMGPGDWAIAGITPLEAHA